MVETGGFECLGHSNWTICSPLSPSSFWNFQFVSILYWEANSYYPRGLIVRRGVFPIPKLNETGGSRCLGHSFWTICSPLSPFCSGNFQFVSSLYWEANSYYPRGPKVRKGRFSNSKTGWDRGVLVPGAFKLDDLHPFKPILFWKFSICFIFILGAQFLLPQRANSEKREFFQFQIWMIHRGLSAWGFQTGPFAAH